MEEVLSKMDPEKRKRLINAALEEFGENVYEKASTNAIVKKAGISKGLLYHYFKNKEELYNYLVKFFFEKCTRDIIDHIDFTKSDIIERIVNTISYKMQVFALYPGIIPFSKNYYAGKTVEELKRVMDHYSPRYYERFFTENIDYSLFKEDIDIQKALQITQWTLEKFSEEYLLLVNTENKLDITEIYNKLDEYLKTLQLAFYK